MLYVIVVILLLLAYTLLFSKIKVFFEYKKNPGEKLYTKLRISLGFVNVSRFAGKLSKKAKTKAEIADKSDEGIIKKIRDATDTLKTVSKIYKKHRWHIRSSLKVENLDFHIKFGLSDAACTGIATGAIWTLLYTGTALVTQVGTLRDHYFEVCPVYTEKGLICQGNIKLSIRVVSLAILAGRILSTYKDIKNK